MAAVAETETKSAERRGNAMSRPRVRDGKAPTVGWKKKVSGTIFLMNEKDGDRLSRPRVRDGTALSFERVFRQMARLKQHHDGFSER